MICFRIIYGNGSYKNLVGTNSIFLSKTIDFRKKNTIIKNTRIGKKWFGCIPTVPNGFTTPISYVVPIYY